MKLKTFQVLIFIGFGCATPISGSLEITAPNTDKDGVSFVEDSKAVFTCSISSYMGSQIWEVGSVLVSRCGALSCVENSSNPTRYNFTSDISTLTFIFTIDPVKSTDTGTVIECFDGSSTHSYTMIVTGPTAQTQDNSMFTTAESNKHTSQNTDKLTTTTNLLQTTTKPPRRNGLFIVVGVIVLCLTIPICLILAFAITKVIKRYRTKSS